MDTEMMPKFTSKDEEIEYWKNLSFKFQKRYVVCRCLKVFNMFICFKYEQVKQVYGW